MNPTQRWKDVKRKKNYKWCQTEMATTIFDNKSGKITSSGKRSNPDNGGSIHNLSDSQCQGKY